MAVGEAPLLLAEPALRAAQDRPGAKVRRWRIVPGGVGGAVLYRPPPIREAPQHLA